MIRARVTNKWSYIHKLQSSYIGSYPSDESELHRSWNLCHLILIIVEVIRVLVRTIKVEETQIEEIQMELKLIPVQKLPY